MHITLDIDMGTNLDKYWHNINSEIEAIKILEKAVQRIPDKRCDENYCADNSDTCKFCKYNIHTYAPYECALKKVTDIKNRLQKYKETHFK